MYKRIKKFLSDKDHYRNKYFIKYHLYKFFDRLLFKLRLKKVDQSNLHDMFNWDKYHLHFRGEVAELEKDYTTGLKKNDYRFIDGHLVKANPDIKPIHPLRFLIYETVLQLNPTSVFELGCGHGMHLHSLQVLKPDLVLAGIDRSAKQLEFLQESFPDLQAQVAVKDATIAFDQDLIGKYDLGFTNAVIMHIHFAETHKVALANLFNTCRKYVILAERWKNHSFMDDIKELHAKKIINWQNINFYYKKSPDTDMCIMICSPEILPYEILTDYNLLPQN
jgi:SAM-dependent methyltransferase